MERTYICIDLKSYYASVVCVHRGFDPLKANLLVADESRSDQTICLAVSPALKVMGVPGRPRLFEAKQKIRDYEISKHTKVDYIVAVPRMAEYERISAQIYGITIPDSGITLIQGLIETISRIEASRKQNRGAYEMDGRRIVKLLEQFTRQNDANIWLELEDGSALTLCCCPKNMADTMEKMVLNRNASYVLT